jgi:hypothetical protein
MACTYVKGAVESGLDVDSTAGILEEDFRGLNAVDLVTRCHR